MKHLCILLILFTDIVASAQKIDNLVSYRDMGHNRTFRISYDNDFFTATDRNYTQGYSFILTLPALSKMPTNHLFMKPKNAHFKYGLGLETNGYTPKDLRSDEIQFGDRPYAAAAMFKSYAIATDSSRKFRLVSSLNLGIIGPAALGDETQTAIHKAIDNVIPRGWQYQMRNDLVLNYELSFEKQLVHTPFFSLQSASYARLGTYNTSASAGLSATLGIVNDPFANPSTNKGFRIYLYAQPLINFSVYDATLKGGLFTDNVYTIPNSDLERLTGQINYGIIIQSKKIYVEYGFSRITREYSTGEPYRWGGFKIGFWV